MSFKWSSNLPKNLNNTFNTSTGHDHDGTDSKIVTAIADDTVTLAKLATTAKKQVFSYKVEDLAADADISTRAILEVPTGLVFTITAAKLISNGTAAGIDDSNTCVVSILNGTNAIATVTYNATTAFPAENVSGSLGTLSATYKVLSAGEKLHFTVTNGTTANPPAFQLQIEYTIADA